MINRYFSIKDIAEVSTENSDEFFYARIAVLSTRPNAHKVLITEDILRRDGASVRGKWIVADSKEGEFMSHSKDEVIVGIVPHNAKIEFERDKDGYLVMYADAILSKIYATDVYKMFKDHSVRSVSVEMMTEDFPTLEDGSIPISGLNIVGITILGTFINPADRNANIKIVQFSDESAENYYKTFSENSESDNSADDSQETNKESSMKKETEAMSMSEEQETAEVNSVVEFAEPEKDKDESEKEMSEEGKEDETKESEDKDKEMSDCGKEMSCGEEGKEMAEDTEEAKEDSEKEDKDKEMSEGDSKEFSEEEKAEETDKEFACLEGEDAELSDGVRKVFSSDKAFAVESVLSMAKELKELKEFKSNVEQKEKEFAVDKVMAGVKSVLSDKEFDDFRKEGLACDNVDAFTNKVKAFAYDKKVENETKDNGGIMEFADAQNGAEPKELTADEIFNKYM